jgi:hypothetical protein
MPSGQGNTIQHATWSKESNWVAREIAQLNISNTPVDVGCRYPYYFRTACSLRLDRYNEVLRQRERFLPFDIRGLQEIAAKAVQRLPRDVVSFRKMAEGGFNRTFVIGMKDGCEVIARLPCSIAFPSQLTVASEVATLRFVRSCGIPVPEVLDYSTRIDNVVGAEYIIMEKAAGEELGNRWFSLPDLDRAKMIGRLSQIENSLFSILLPASGSIFYKKDLDKSTPSLKIPGTEFCIGPSVEQRWWHDRRGQLDVYRGPCKVLP